MSWSLPQVAAQATLASLAAVSLALPSRAERRRALAGALLLALALASLRVAGGPDWRQAALAPSYLAITAAIGLLALGWTGGLAVVAGWRGGWTGARRNLGLLAGLVALVLGLPILVPLAAGGGWGPTLLAMAGLVATGGLGIGLVPRLGLGRAVRRVDRLLGAPADPGMAPEVWDTSARRLLAAQAACALLAFWVGHLLLLLAVIFAGAITGLLLQRRLARGPSGAPSVLLALLVLAVVARLLIQVAGDMPLTLRALSGAPYSGAFELLVSLPASLAAWALLRLWPFHLAPRGPLTGLLGAALLARVVGPLLPNGLVHWQAVLYPLAVVAAWHAAATRRDEEALGSLGALGLLAGTTAAGWCGTFAILGGVALTRPDVLRQAGWPRDARGEAGRGLLVLLGVPLLLPILAGALPAQTFYTVAAVAGLVAVLWADRGATGLVDPSR